MKSKRPVAAMLLVCGGFVANILLQAQSQGNAPQPAQQPALLSVVAGPELVKIEAPGGHLPRVTGMNADGDVVGNYSIHGFLYRNGKLITIDYPNAKLTLLWSISDSGFILGDYVDSADLNYKGRYFVRSPQGEFKALTLPENFPKKGRSVFFRNITNDGTPIGVEWGNDEDSVIYVLEGTSLRELPKFPKSIAIRRISATGIILGSVDKAGAVWRNGALSTFEYPGAKSTIAYGINDHDEIVGTFDETLDTGRCFRRSATGEMAELVIPGAVKCTAMDISRNGEVAGEYIPSFIDGYSRAFRWRPGAAQPVQRAAAPAAPAMAPRAAPPAPKAVSYVPASLATGEVTTLDAPGGTITSFDGINSFGEVAGTTEIGAVQQGFIWRDGNFSMFSYPGAVRTLVSGISDGGLILGTYVHPSNTGVSRYFTRLRDGSFVNPKPGLYDARNFAIECLSSSGTYFGGVNNSGQRQVASYDNVNFRVLYDLDYTIANFKIWGANAAGDIVGSKLNSRGETVGFVLRQGALQELSYPGAKSTSARGINGRGEIVGQFVVEDYVNYCFRRDAAGNYATLKMPAGRHCNASGINDSGVIVGSYHDGTTTHGFLWQPVVGGPVGAAGTASVVPGAERVACPAYMAKVLTETQKGARRLGMSLLGQDYQDAMKANDLHKAQQKLSAMIQSYPEFWLPYLRMGELLLERNQAAEASFMLEKGILVAQCALNGTDAEIKPTKSNLAILQANLGLAFNEVKIKNRAVAALKTAMQIDPENGEAAVLACVAFAVMKDTANGPKPCETAVKAFPKNVEAWIGKATLAVETTPRNFNGTYLFSVDTLVAMQTVIRLAPNSETAKYFEKLLDPESGKPKP